MYVSMKDILQHAHENTYAVMAMNSINMEMARAGIEAAEEERSALIINIGPGQMKNHAHASEMVPLVIDLAKRATVPITLNLDHGQAFESVVDCINMGFKSVMIDASSCEFEENVHRTKTICDLAHPLNICVEGELGHVGQAIDEDDTDLDLFTNPAQAKEFVTRTRVDALAVAVGTAHGAYPKGKIPKLDFERLSLLKQTLDMPLVLHGGSGAGEENLKKAVACGINKINVCTDAFQVGKDAMLKALEENEKTDYMHLCMAAEAAIKAFVKNYMRIIGSSGRYIFGEAVLSGHE